MLEHALHAPEASARQDGDLSGGLPRRFIEHRRRDHAGAFGGRRRDAEANQPCRQNNHQGERGKNAGARHGNLHCEVYSGLNSGWTSGLRHLKRSSDSPVLTT